MARCATCAILVAWGASSSQWCSSWGAPRGAKSVRRSYYDCMPPETPSLELVCGGACHDWIVATCPGVGFVY